MTLNIVTSEEDIIATLRDGLVPPVYETEFPDDVPVSLNAAGMFDPYYTVVFGGPIRAAQGRGITSVRKDAMREFVAMYCVAPTPEVLRVLKNNAFNLMTGYVPDNGSELIPEGGMAYSSTQTTVKPHKYMKFLVWTYFTNLTR